MKPFKKKAPLSLSQRNVNEVLHNRLGLRRPWTVTKLVVTDANCDITKGQFLVMCALARTAKGKKRDFFPYLRGSVTCQRRLLWSEIMSLKDPLDPPKAPMLKTTAPLCAGGSSSTIARECRAPLQSALYVSQPFKYGNPERLKKLRFQRVLCSSFCLFLLNLLFAVMQFLWDTTIWGTWNLIMNPGAHRACSQTALIYIIGAKRINKLSNT